MTGQQKNELWNGFYDAARSLYELLEYDLDETVKIAEFPPPTELDIYAGVTIWRLTGLPEGRWARDRGRLEWTVRDLVRELRDDIRGRFMRLFVNPTPEQFDAAVPDPAQCYRLNVDKFLAQGHDESDFADKLRLVARQAEHGEVCFMVDGSAQNLGKLWVSMLDPFCRLLLEELIHSPKQVSNLTLILLSDDLAELVLSRCVIECLKLDVIPHIGLLRFITARLLGVVF